MPPKYSYALKDLAVFLGFFELSEDELKQRLKNKSDTSSNLSHMTATGFNVAKSHGLDVIIEDQEQKDEEETEEQKATRVKGNSGE